MKHFYRPRSEGDNVIGSVRPSVRPFVCLSSLPVRGFCLSVIIRACADNSADAVDRLLMIESDESDQI